MMFILIVNHITVKGENSYELKMKTKEGKILCDILLSDVFVSRYDFLDIIDLIKRCYRLSWVDLKIQGEEIIFQK